MVAFAAAPPLLLPGGRALCVRGRARRAPTTSVRRRRAAGQPLRMVRSADGVPASGEDGGLNINDAKYKSQRSIIAADKNVTPKEINELLVKAGKPARDPEKWARAIDNSYVVVHARLLKSNALVCFARATSDRALNGTIWDLVTDPALPDEKTMARNVVTYLLREIRRTVPTCSIALISDPDQVGFFEGLDFVSSPDGITSMILSQEYEPTRSIPIPDERK